MAYIGPLAIDGGLLTTDVVGPLATITEWRDVAAVFPSDSDKKLAELPTNMNPALLTNTSRPRFVYPNYVVPNRPFAVMPPVSGVSVYAWCRQRPPLPLKTTDKVYIDQVLLQYDACWMYAVDDGTIPAQVNKFQVLAQNRRRMVKAGFAQHPLELDPRTSGDAAMEGVEDTTWFWLDKDPLA